MGPSSDEIDREIRETRSRLDQELAVLERRAATSARRAGLVAAGVGAGLVAVALVVIVYRRRRRDARVRGFLESLRGLPGGVGTRLRQRLPLKVVVTDRAHEERASDALVGIARQVAPAVIGSAAGAIASRIRRGAAPRAGEPD